MNLNRIKNFYETLRWYFSKRNNTELFLVKCLTANGQHIVKDLNTHATMVCLIPNPRAMTMYVNIPNKHKSRKEVEQLVQDAIVKALKDVNLSCEVILECVK